MKKVWIYQADRFLSDAEVAEINAMVADFSTGWTAHGSALAGRGEVLHHLFLVLEVDEALARVTGCSIDKSVYFIKGLEQRFGVGFFDRMKVAYRDDAGQVQLVDRAAFAELVQSGEIHEQTLVFNNLVQTVAEMERGWEIPFKDSWHSKVFARSA